MAIHLSLESPSLQNICTLYVILYSSLFLRSKILHMCFCSFDVQCNKSKYMKQWLYFLNKFRFTYWNCASIGTLWYVSWSSFPIRKHPSVFTDERYSFDKSTLFAHISTGIFSETFAEFDSHFLACMLVLPQNVYSSWYSLMPQFSSPTDSMLSSVYIKFNIASTVTRCASFKSNSCFWEMSCASKSAYFTPNTKLLDSNTSGFVASSIISHRKQRYFRFWGASSILKYISKTLHTKATGYFWFLLILQKISFKLWALMNYIIQTDHISFCCCSKYNSPFCCCFILGHNREMWQVPHCWIFFKVIHFKCTHLSHVPFFKAPTKYTAVASGSGKFFIFR